MRRGVSAIIPCRNGERYLGACIASILAQPCPELEVIVVDNGSTDRSAEVARALGSRVHVIVEAEPGLARARELGVAAAQGAVFAFSDADDLWASDRLPHQLDHLAGLDARAISTGLTQPFITPELGEIPADFDPRPQFFRHPGAMLIPRPVFETIGSFGVGTGHDTIEWIGHAVDQGVGFVRFDQVVQHRRVHGANHSRAEGLRTSDFARSLKAVLDRRRGGAE